MTISDVSRPLSLTALELTGDGHAVLPDIHASFARGLTLQAWVRLADLAERATIFAFAERADSRPFSVAVAAGSGDLVLEFVDRTNTPRTLVAPAALVAGKWAHVSVVLSERDTARIVVDGRERASGKLALPAAGPRRLGFLGRSLARADETLHGALADVRLWTRDLSNDEIEASRTRRLTGHEPELAAYWPLDALVGGRLADLSGHDRSARPVAAKLVAAPDLPLKPGAAPTPALALRAGDTISATSSTPRSSPVVTVQAWVRVAKLTAGACLLEFGDGDAKGSAVALTVLRADGTLRVAIRESGHLVGILDAGRPLVAGEWTHVSVALGRDEVALFLAGERVGVARLVRLPSPPFTGYRWHSLVVGAGREGAAIDADVAEVRLFTRRLTDRQVARSVRRTMLGTEDGLAINWRLDEGRGLVARNSGQLGNDASVAVTAACEGTIKGGEWLQDSGLARARPADARTLRGLLLDGGGAVRLPGLPAGFGEGYTIEAWVRHDGFNGAPIVELVDRRGPKGERRDVDASDASSFDRISLQTLGDEPTLQFVASRGLADPGAVGGLRLLTAKDVLKAGRWTHVAATVLPSGLVTLHVDGAKVAEKALFSAAEVVADASAVRRFALLGRGAGSNKRLVGALAEVRIWGRALSGGELRDRRWLRAGGGEYGLVRCYHLDDIEAGTLADASSNRAAGTLAGGVVREIPDLPLWPADARVGAGVDAVCKLMQDPRVATVNGKRTSSHVAVFEVCLSARTGSGAPAGKAAIEVSVDEPVVLRHDIGDGVDLLAAPGRPVKLTTNHAGKARLTIDAGRFKLGARDALRCPVLKVRTDEMPAGQWDVILPDLQAFESLATATGDSLRAGTPARLGRKQTPSPFARAVTAADAEELAATVRTLMNAASQAALVVDDVSPVSFAADDEGPATLAVVASPSRGAAGRVDADAPIRRTIPAREVPAPEGQILSFAAGGEQEILAVEMIAAPTFVAADDGPQSFGLGDGETRIARARRLRERRERLGEKIETAFKEFGEATREFFDDLGDLIKSAVQKPFGEFIKDLAGKLDDAMIVALKTIDPSGRAVEAYQIVIEVGGKVIRTVIDSVESAIDATAAFFDKLGASVKRIVDHLAALFDWDDILATSDVFHANHRRQLARWPGTIRAVIPSWERLMDHSEQRMTSAIDGALRSLGVAAPTGEGSESDERSSFVLGKFQDNADRLAFAGDDVPDVDMSLLAKISTSFNIDGIGEDFKAAFKSIDLEEAVKDPKEFFVAGASTVLLAVKALIQFGMRTIKVSGVLLLKLIERVAEWIVALANKRINVPGLTDFVETHILRGRPLTLLTLFAVLEAIPYTIIYKLTTGSHEGPFAGASTFADEDDALDEKELEKAIAESMAGTNSAIEAVQAAALAAQRRKEHANAITNVVCGVVSGIAATVSEFGKDKNQAIASTRLISAVCGAVICGVTGFPSGDARQDKLEITGWTLGLVGSVIAAVDGINGVIYAVKQKGPFKAIGTAMTYVSAGWSTVQFAFTIGVASHRALHPAEAQTKDEIGCDALMTTANVCGCVSGMSAFLADAKPEAMIGISLVALLAQLGFGLGSIGWMIKLEQQADAAALAAP